MTGRREEEPGAGSSIGGVHGSDASPPPPRNAGAPAPSPASSNKGPAASPSSSRGSDAEEEQRRAKGKMLATDESPPRATANAGAGNKLMGDAIRCHDANASNSKPSSRAGTSNKRKQDRHHPFWFGTDSDGQSTSSAGSDLLPVSLSTIGVVTDHLRAMLRDLGVTPTRVYGKMMSRSDRVMQQCRLLMSCKSWRAAAHGPFPLDAFLTAAEKAAAARGAGLEVLALDRAGEVYQGMKCKYLASNSGYRVIGKWGDFLRRNGLVARDAGGHNGGNRADDVMIDLWLFRSAPGGRLGIVFVHYRKGDAAHADAAFEEEMGRPRKIRRRGAATEDEEDDEDEGGGGNDVAMEGDAYYDALRENEEAGNNGQGEEANPLFSHAIAAKAVEEDTGASKGKAAATLALDADDDGVKEEQPGAQGKATSPSSSSMADGAKAAEGSSASLSSDDEAEEEETDAPSTALDVLLSSCKQDVLQAAETLMEISRGVW